MAEAAAPDDPVDRRPHVHRVSGPEAWESWYVRYPKVNRAHVVPRMYLRNFSDGEAVAVHVIEQPGSRVMSIGSVGTRKRFYRRHRPDGTPIDDIEWSLAQAEAKAAPVLAQLGTTWPLPIDEKAGIGELFGLQLIRGPRWRRWWGQATGDWLDEQRAEVEPEKLAALEAALTNDTYRLVHMLQVAHKMATVFGSAHWTLVEFSSPLLATSDHPVVVWPLSVRARAPAATAANVGVLETLELRIPVSPTRLLLLTWRDVPDAHESRVSGTRYHAANANAFTVAEADAQWFHLPGRTPPVASGRLLPLSTQLVAGYNAASARGSERRLQASEIVNAQLGSEDLPNAFDVVTIAGSSPGGEGASGSRGSG